MTGADLEVEVVAEPAQTAIDEFNQFGLGSEEVTMRYLQAAMPGTVWSLRKLRELTNAGKIYGFKQGRRWFFKRGDLDAYVFSLAHDADA